MLSHHAPGSAGLGPVPESHLPASPSFSANECFHEALVGPNAILCPGLIAARLRGMSA